jgi:hypothetical protein
MLDRRTDGTDGGYHRIPLLIGTIFSFKSSVTWFQARLRSRLIIDYFQVTQKKRFWIYYISLVKKYLTHLFISSVRLTAHLVLYFLRYNCKVFHLLVY